MSSSNTSPVKVYIPLDSAAIAMGANSVTQSLEALLNTHVLNVQIIRNGSRGMIWAEPVLEVLSARGRIAFANVTSEVVEQLFTLGVFDPALNTDELVPDFHPSYLGFTEEIPWLKKQQRLTFERCGISDPLDLDEYINLGGLKALKQVLGQAPQKTVDAIKHSGLRGRGGAAFPAGIKWQTVYECINDTKYIVCNADEGDSGTFADRMIMEGDPFLLIEGMVIAGYATGAKSGYIYLRSEYPVARKILTQAINIAKHHQLLGDDILGSEFDFNIELFVGAGAYICGEETSLLESLEGRRGEVRSKPPLPAHQGLFGKPTLIHNVISLCSVPAAIKDNGTVYASIGTKRSLGTLTIQLAGNVKRGGLIEIPFGASLREVIEEYGGGSQSGRPVHAIQIGGPLGAYLPESVWDTPLDYEAFTEIDAGIGHGGIIVFDDTVNLREQAEYAFQFCVEESCGKCTPCRIGSQRGVDHFQNAENPTLVDLDSVGKLCDLMESASLCAMGGMTPIPVRSAMRYFPEDFNQPYRSKGEPSA